MNRSIWILTAVAVFAGAVYAEEPEKPEKPDFEPWSKIGKKMTKVQEGFWNIYQDKKKRKFWLEVTSANLKKPFLMATSITGGTTMRGWQWNDWLLLWKVHEKKLVLLERNAGFTDPKGKKPLKEAINKTYTDRVVATYPIMGKGPKGGYLIDGQRFFASGAATFFGGVGRSKDASLAEFDAKNFPKNTEVSVTLPRAGSGTLVTLHYSLSKLEKTGYKPRVADDRIGYFTTNLKDFGTDNKDEHRMKRLINRWHLVKEEPKLELSPPKEKIEFFIEKTVPVRWQRYVRQGILEWNKAFAKIGFDQPIVVHQQTDTRHNELDPEDIRYNFFRWIYSESAFAMGPSRVDPRTGEILDADIIMDDEYIRFTLKEYRMEIKEVPAALLGPNGKDILARHPFRRLGLVAAPDEFGPLPADAVRPNLSPHARRAFCSLGNGVRHQLGCCSLLFNASVGEGKAKDPIPEELLGQFIKDTVMHEVGHTLGLRHNFKASTYRTLDEINSDAKPDAIAGSVMDYNPLVVAGDGRPQGNWAMRTIGPYDYWAIEYGYTPKDADLPKVLERVAEKGLDFATDEDTMMHDPYVSRWDLGADPLAFSKERIALMLRLRKNLEERAVDKGERYNRLRRAMDMQFFEARNAGRRAIRFIGGEHIHRDHRGDKDARAPLVPVEAAKQREALDFVCDVLLSGKYFEFEPDVLRKLAPDFHGDDFFALFFEGHAYPYLDNVLAVQAQMMIGLLSSSRLQRLLDARYKVDKEADVLTVPEVFDALNRAIFGSLQQAAAAKSTNRNPALDDMQRSLQREYVGQLIYMAVEGRWTPAPIKTLARHYVRTLADQIDAVLRANGALDTYTVAHLEECRTRLTKALEASYQYKD